MRAGLQIASCYLVSLIRSESVSGRRWKRWNAMTQDFKANIAGLPLRATSLNAAQTDRIESGKALCELRKADRKSLRNAILRSRCTLFAQSLIDDETIDILHNMNTVLFVRAIGLNKYRILFGTDSESIVSALIKVGSTTKGPECYWIEKAVEHYMWIILDEVWTQVIKETVELVQVCEPGTPEVGSGTTYHEQGGGSEFDVNIS